jgi:hypothetical protein
MSLDEKFLLAIYGSALCDSSALYCSAPITSGRRFLQWVQQRGNDIRDVDHAAVDHGDEHRSQVVDPNLAHAKAIVANLRRLSPIPVIDPTAVPHIAAWGQSEWLRFWEAVIARFAIAAIFVNDWQFSYGCAHEFMYATSIGLPAFSEHGAPIKVADGRALIAAAVREIRSFGGSTARLETVLRADGPQTLTASSELTSLRDLLEAHWENASQRRDT